MEGACFYLSQIEQFSEDSKTVICYPGKNEKTLPKAGSRVCVEGVLKPFRKASNPGEFDAAAYYGRKGFLFSMQKVTVVKESRSYSRIQEAAAQFRRCLLYTSMENDICICFLLSAAFTFKICGRFKQQNHICFSVILGNRDMAAFVS